MAIRHAFSHDLAVHDPQLLSHSRLDLWNEPDRRISLPVWDFLHVFRRCICRSSYLAPRLAPAAHMVNWPKAHAARIYRPLTLMAPPGPDPGPDGQRSHQNRRPDQAFGQSGGITGRASTRQSESAAAQVRLPVSVRPPRAAGARSRAGPPQVSSGERCGPTETPAHRDVREDGRG